MTRRSVNRELRLRAVTSGPSLEPPDPPPECTWCDGTGTLLVAAVWLGNYHDAPMPWGNLPPDNPDRVKCRRCDGTGNEPEPDPRDDPRVDDRIKERRAQERG